MTDLPGGLFIGWYTRAKNRTGLQLLGSSDGKTFEQRRSVESTLHASNHPQLGSADSEPRIILQAPIPDHQGGRGPVRRAVARCGGSGLSNAPMILRSLGHSATFPHLSGGNAVRLDATWTEIGGLGTNVVLHRARTQVP